MKTTDTPAPRRGRPALDESERRSKIARARLNPIERGRLDAYLEARGITESDLVRERLAPIIAGELTAA